MTRGDATAPPPPAAPAMRPTLTGLVGAGMAAIMTAALAVAEALDDKGDLAWAAVFAVLAAPFVAAAVISWRPVERRSLLLRAAVVVAFATAALGSVRYGAGFAFLFAPPTALLAIAAGLIFQPSAKR